MAVATTTSDHSQDWPKILDALMSGVAHHISNRVAVLSGIADLLTTNASPPPPVLQALASEIPKLEEAIQLLRLLPACDESAEAMEPLRAVNNAIALARLHPNLRHVTIATAVAESIPPVLARPTAFTHDIVSAIVHAAAEMSGGTLSVSVTVANTNVHITAGRYTVPAQTLVSARQTRAS